MRRFGRGFNIRDLAELIFLTYHGMFENWTHEDLLRQWHELRIMTLGTVHMEADTEATVNQFLRELALRPTKIAYEVLPIPCMEIVPVVVEFLRASLSDGWPPAQCKFQDDDKGYVIIDTTFQC